MSKSDCSKAKSFMEILKAERDKFIKQLEDELADIKRQAMIEVDRELEHFKNKYKDGVL